jgi:hypothetical protein
MEDFQKKALEKAAKITEIDIKNMAENLKVMTREQYRLLDKYMNGGLRLLVHSQTKKIGEG